MKNSNAFICLMLLLTIFANTMQINEILTKVKDPSHFKISPKGKNIAVTNSYQLQILRRVRTGDNSQYSSFVIQYPSIIHKVAWLQFGYLVVATSDNIFIYNQKNVPVSNRKMKGVTLAITQQPQSKCVYVLWRQMDSVMQLSQLKITNYVDYNQNEKMTKFLILQRYYMAVSYVSKHRYLYLTDQFQSIDMYSFSTNSFKKTVKMNMNQILEIKTQVNTQNVFVYNFIGDFALLETGNVVKKWKDTIYQIGCFCGTERVFLANNDELKYFSEDKTKAIKLKILGMRGELMAIQCSINQNDDALLYAIDQTGLLVIANIFEQQESDTYTVNSQYFIIGGILLLLIILIVIKVCCCAKKIQINPADPKSEQLQDKLNVYSQLKELTPGDNNLK